MAKKDKQTTPEEKIDYKKHLVLYTDGGSRENGFGGWGLHGYMYSDEPPTKGSGNPSYKLTSDGYIDSTTFKNSKGKLVEVKPELYFDGFGSFLNPTTNNLAELMGVVNALNIPQHHDVSSVKVFTDSQYVVVGANDHLERWKTNGWLKKDGTQITSQAEWLMLSDQMTKVKDKNIDLKISWIKGHAGHLGNEIADKSATIGTLHSKIGVLKSEVDTVPAQGYWKSKTDKHPFLSAKRCYFLTDPATVIKGQYFVGDHGSDDVVQGKRQTDDSIGYLELNEPDELIETVRTKQLEENNLNSIATILYLDTLFSARVSEGINKYGPLFLVRRNKFESDLVPINELKNIKNDSSLVTKGQTPPRISMRTFLGISELKGVLDAWRNNDPNIIMTDITDVFYEKNKKDEIKLKDKIASGVNKIDAQIFYGQTDNLKEYNLELYFNNDLPDRNTLKKIESIHPEVKVLTWMESKNCFKYVTVIKVENGIGIWSNTSANNKFIEA